MEGATLTAILTNFANIFNSGVQNVMPYAKGIFVTIVSIDLIWSYLKTLDEGDHLKMLMFKCIKYGLFYWFITDYKSLVDSLLDGFVVVGFAAGGNAVPASTITDPSYIISKGLQTAWPMLKSLKDTNILTIDLGRQLTMILAYILTVFAFFVMAIQVFITYLEFYIVGALAIIYLPWGAFDKTAFMAEKAIGALIAMGTKLMVLAFVLAATIPMIEKIKLPENPDSEQCYLVLGSVAAIAILCWQAPGLAASLLAGSPQLSGTKAVGAGAAAMSMISTVTSRIPGLGGMGGGAGGGARGVSAAANVSAAVGDMRNVFDTGGTGGAGKMSFDPQSVKNMTERFTPNDTQPRSNKDK
jgi:type IV secretion system protein TrbL